MNLTGRSALVTGASRGIGAATAFKFASEGYNVAINYFNSKDKAEQLKEMILKKYDVSVLLVQANLDDELDIKKMVKAVVDTFENIDVLVNNAGIAIDSLVEDKTV